MKIAGASTSPLLKSTLLPQKLFLSLLELVKPLDANTALVNSKLLGQITVSVKEPLETSTLYHASILKDKTGFSLLEAFKLPIEVKKILTLKPLMSIEQFISQLLEGNSPKKIALESLTSLLMLSQDKEEVKESLSQFLQLLQTQEPIIPLSYSNGSGYINFKKIIKKQDNYQVPFEAYFQTLGIITGFVSFFKQKKEAHLKVLSEQTKEHLQSHAKTLPMELFVIVDKKIIVKPQTSLLDIQA